MSIGRTRWVDGGYAGVLFSCGGGVLIVLLSFESAMEDAQWDKAPVPTRAVFRAPKSGAGPGLSIEMTVQGAPKVRGKGTKCDVMEQDGTKMGIRASIHRLGTREGARDLVVRGRHP